MPLPESRSLRHLPLLTLIAVSLGLGLAVLQPALLVQAAPSLPPPLKITTPSTKSSPPNAIFKKAYSFTLGATVQPTGGADSWSITSGSLPPGLGLSTSGIISGTASAVSQDNFTATVSDSLGSTSKAFTLWSVGSGLEAGAPPQSEAEGRSFCKAYASGAVSEPYGLDGIYACSPYNTKGNTPFDEAGHVSFQCVDLSVRFLWAVYGIWAGPGTDDGNINGYDIASYVHRAYHIPVGTPGVSPLPLPGDVISFGPGGAVAAGVGHTAVVVADVSSTSFKIMSQNMTSQYQDGGAGEQVVYVSSQYQGQVRFANQGWDGTGASWLQLAGTQSSPLPTSSPTPVTRDFQITTASDYASPPNATVGQAYSFQFAATNGFPGPYSWSIIQGSLPPGLSLHAGGVISGTPTAISRNGSFTVKVSDAGSKTAAKIFTLWSNRNPSTTSGLAIRKPSNSDLLPSATVLTPYTFSFTATGGDGDYSWSMVSGKLPPGFLFLPNGVIAGLPLLGGTSGTFTVEVTSGAKSTERSFRLQVSRASSVGGTRMCGTLKGVFGDETHVMVEGMSCQQAQELFAQGGPVEAPGWAGKSQCAFTYASTTYTATCSLGKKSITYTGILAGGKGG